MIHKEDLDRVFIRITEAVRYLLRYSRGFEGTDYLLGRLQYLQFNAALTPNALRRFKLFCRVCTSTSRCRVITSIEQADRPDFQAAPESLFLRREKRPGWVVVQRRPEATNPSQRL